MRLLELFCGAGGAAVGYMRAGFDHIVGVDLVEQPRYPVEFVQGDALEYAQEYGHDFDLVHASPPCQAYSITRHQHKGRKHPAVVPAVRALLEKLGVPYVIENVVGAPLVRPVVLCGTMFGLQVFRHRLFETMPWMLGPPHVKHSMYGKIVRQGDPPNGPGSYITVTGNFCSLAAGGRAMGIDWMIKRELAQAIPPAYTDYIGRRILATVGGT